MDGFATEWEQSEIFSSGRISDSDNNWYRVQGQEVELDSIGRCLLVVGEPVTFDFEIKVNPNTGRSFRRAFNVKRPWKETRIDPNTWRETCKVIDNNWLIRMIGGRLTIDRDECEYDFLEPGQIVKCSVRPPRRGLTWRGVDLTILASSEDDYDDWKAEAQ